MRPAPARTCPRGGRIPGPPAVRPRRSGLFRARAPAVLPIPNLVFTEGTLIQTLAQLKARSRHQGAGAADEQISAEQATRALGMLPPTTTPRWPRTRAASTFYLLSESTSGYVLFLSNEYVHELLPVVRLHLDQFIY